MLRLAFAKFKRGAGLTHQDTLNDKRVNEVKARLDLRRKVRHFKAIYQYAKSF